jgi:hypothetical protein
MHSLIYNKIIFGKSNENLIDIDRFKRVSNLPNLRYFPDQKIKKNL